MASQLMKLMVSSLLLIGFANGAPQVLSEIDTYDDLLAIESQFIENEIDPSVQKILPAPQGFNGERFSAPPLKFTPDFVAPPREPSRNNNNNNNFLQQPSRNNNNNNFLQQPSRNNNNNNFLQQPSRNNNNNNNFLQQPSRNNNNNNNFFQQPSRNNNNFASQPSPNTFTPRPTPLRPQVSQQQSSGSTTNLQINPNDPQSYSFSFETPEMKRDEAGQPKGSDSYVQTGGWEYVGDDGRIYSVRFIADENGFRPVGNHLPTPPPLPPALQRFEDARNGRLSKARQG